MKGIFQLVVLLSSSAKKARGARRQNICQFHNFALETTSLRAHHNCGQPKLSWSSELLEDKSFLRHANGGNVFRLVVVNLLHDRAKASKWKSIKVRNCQRWKLSKLEAVKLNSRSRGSPRECNRSQ